MVSKAGMVYVSGDVHRPSGVAMDNTSMTVLQAIAMAEGANPTAALNKARLIRTSGSSEIPLRLKDMLSSKSPDVRLQAEDIVFVPNSAAENRTRADPGSHHSNRNRTGDVRSPMNQGRGRAGGQDTLQSSGLATARAQRLVNKCRISFPDGYANRLGCGGRA